VAVFSLLLSIIIGTAAGLAAPRLIPRPDLRHGFIVGPLLGIAGAFALMIVGQILGLGGADTGAGMVITMIGALALPLLRQRYARRKPAIDSGAPRAAPPPAGAAVSAVSTSVPSQPKTSQAAPPQPLAEPQPAREPRPGPRMAFDAFVSYSQQDKAYADAACAKLEAEGIRCWIAPRDIVHGMDWGEAIIDAIRGAKVMVLIFSAHANASPQIKREVERAVHRGIAIVPVRVEDVTPTKSLEYFISSAHWLDAITPPLEMHLKQLAVSVKTLVQMAPDGTAS
jgi:uncharacterized membrane protein YeaQ/YmgE (transglycosylase-associated protein family)